jgi:CMP-N,N'-diacetyllegionaminic acid synthase
MAPSIIALIPARSGSQRVRDKNIRPLAGHPLLAYTISAALDSGVFDAVVVSTDSPRYGEIARHYGAEVPFLRPAEIAHEHSPDIEWVEHALERLKQMGRTYECFSILRPTSPFRLDETIRRAWNAFLTEAQRVDSLRAVEKCSQHPGKMWTVRRNRMSPLLPFYHDDQPWHSCQTKSLPEVYVQNASLEIAWNRVVVNNTIAGHTVMPFFTEGNEGLDINRESDWLQVEYLIDRGMAELPRVSAAPARVNQPWHEGAFIGET